MASGLLSGAMTRERIVALPEGDWRKRSKNFLEPALSHSLVLVETLREIGRRHNATPGAVAIAWTLRNPAVTGAIVGIRKPQQVDGTVIATDIRLSTSEAIAIEQVLSLQPA
jgi:aryl-alcohol dehydrogenase-like predicted oxidoreductase